jgi:NAD(P)-dependent dehydrogenase (short-subunit alcohol dehydrogenase family)
MLTALITGANRGIGLELTRLLRARGDSVIATCRKASPELEHTGAEIVEAVDVGSDESVAALATRLEGRSIDWLVNNAGILQSTSLGNLDFEAMERQFRVNSLGPLRVTAALRSRLAAGSKVFIITSRMGSIEDNTSGGSYGYRMSKAAVNIAGRSLAIDLKDDGISVFLLHPGWVSTEMTGGTGIPVTQSAEGLVRMMDGLGPDDSGTFWHQEGYALPW